MKRLNKNIVKMSRTDTCNIQEVEILVEEVQTYPWLYDKLGKGYKEKYQK